MTWKTGANSPLGLAAVNPTLADTAIPNGTPVGTVRNFIEDTQGPGELIYLPGVASLVAGDMVYYDLLPSGPTVVRSNVGVGANTGRLVAVALGPVLAGQYGWYQISGVAIVNIAGAGAVGPLFVTATSGQGSSATTAGSQVSGARISAAVGTPAAGKSYVTLDRPRLQTQIT